MPNRICNNEPEGGRVDDVLEFDGASDKLFADRKVEQWTQDPVDLYS